MSRYFVFAQSNPGNKVVAIPIHTLNLCYQNRVCCQQFETFSKQQYLFALFDVRSQNNVKNKILFGLGQLKF